MRSINKTQDGTLTVKNTFAPSVYKLYGVKVGDLKGFIRRERANPHQPFRGVLLEEATKGNAIRVLDEKNVTDLDTAILMLLDNGIKVFEFDCTQGLAKWLAE